jgi:putative phosphoribosyl transferase
VKKIGAPVRPELAMNAVSEDGDSIFNESLVSILDSERLHVEESAREKATEVQAQLAAFRKVMPMVLIKGRADILVGDELAAGATMAAAAAASVQVLKSRGALYGGM